MARHFSEISLTSERILIVEKKSPILYEKLKKVLEMYDVMIQKTPKLPPLYNRYSRIFFLEDTFDESTKFSEDVRVTVIHVKPYSKLVIPSAKTSNKIKHIVVSSEQITDEELTQLLWFSMSSDSEQILDLRKKHTQPKSRPTTRNSSSGPPKYIIIAFIALCTAFILPLIVASMLHIMMLNSFVSGQISAVSYLQPTTRALTNASALLYAPARPIYSLFYATSVPESLLRLNANTEEYVDQAKRLTILQRKTLSDLSSTTNSQTKTDQLLRDLTELDYVNSQFQKYSDRLISVVPTFHQSLVQLKNNLKNAQKSSDKLSKTIPIFKIILGSTTPQNIIVLFIDNSRLRGAGGVIDSLGIVTVENASISSSRFYSPKELQTSEVDLDRIAGILTGYQPTEATYLNDSTTSIDLYDTQDKIRSHLASTIGRTNLNATLLITTSGLQNILEVFPDLYLTVENEKINAENLSLKQQLHKQDPYFLPHLLETMSQTIGTVDLNILLKTIFNSLDEKQLALLWSNKTIQADLDALYWSGKTIAPQCIVNNGACINDYLFSIDQDLTTRTGPAYIQKTQSKFVRFVDNTTLESDVRLTWKNESPLPDNQGGTYKIYTQMLLPNNSTVTEITRNNVLVEQIDELTGKYKIVGLYLEVPTRQKVELKISYSMPVRLRAVTNYQLVTQKQLGSFTSNFIFESVLPDGYTIGAKNIEPVVKSGRIFYNTTLNTDKLFFLELKKKD